MFPLNAVAQSYKGVNTDYTSVYREMILLLDKRDELVLGLLESGAVYLHDGYEYRASEYGLQELHRILQERGF